MVFKKNLRPLSKGGQIIKHRGKGSQQAPLPARGALNALSNAPGALVNNYAKATPVSQPGGDVSQGAPPDLGGGGYG